MVRILRFFILGLTRGFRQHNKEMKIEDLKNLMTGEISKFSVLAQCMTWEDRRVEDFKISEICMHK
jgi:hypothetical protein